MEHRQNSADLPPSGNKSSVDLMEKDVAASTLDMRALAQIVLETVRAPLLVLDNDLEILAASDFFLRVFRLGVEETRGQTLFALDNGAWDIPELRVLMGRLQSHHDVTDDFALAHEFPRMGTRHLLFHARRAPTTGGTPAFILLGIEDVTERLAIEAEKSRLQRRTDELLKQKELLLREMQHRIVNSLQIIASILMLKARTVTSEEARQQLRDAHRRVMSVAAVQEHLNASGRVDVIEIAPYLTKLCASLAESMIGEGAAKIAVVADERAIPSSDAVCLGLIVTELVINALKYAFPNGHDAPAVTVGYEVHGPDWKLSVTDNGVGHPESVGPRKGGLGTALVAALAQQLEAKVAISNSPTGMSISVTHATFVSRSAALTPGGLPRL